MPNNTTHQTLGALIGVAGYTAYKKSMNEAPDIRDALISAIAGSFVASIPDVLEPALSPNHRGIFHSEETLLSSVIVVNNILNNPNMAAKQKFALLTGIVAYCSHLLQDSITPAGLPSILLDWNDGEGEEYESR